MKRINNPDIIQEIEISKRKPLPPKPPLIRTIKQGVSVFCKNCNSTIKSIWYKNPIV